jgi:hypothetical protein
MIQEQKTEQMHALISEAYAIICVKEGIICVDSSKKGG